jgi:hypothetical protein
MFPHPFLTDNLSPARTERALALIAFLEAEAFSQVNFEVLQPIHARFGPDGAGWTAAQATETINDVQAGRFIRAMYGPLGLDVFPDGLLLMQVPQSEACQPDAPFDYGNEVKIGEEYWNYYIFCPDQDRRARAFPAGASPLKPPSNRTRFDHVDFWGGSPSADWLAATARAAHALIVAAPAITMSKLFTTLYDADYRVNRHFRIVLNILKVGGYAQAPDEGRDAQFEVGRKTWTGATRVTASMEGAEPEQRSAWPMLAPHRPSIAHSHLQINDRSTPSAMLALRMIEECPTITRRALVKKLRAVDVIRTSRHAEAAIDDLVAMGYVRIVIRPGADTFELLRGPSQGRSVQSSDDEQEAAPVPTFSAPLVEADPDLTRRLTAMWKESRP